MVNATRISGAVNGGYSSLSLRPPPRVTGLQQEPRHDALRLSCERYWKLMSSAPVRCTRISSVQYWTKGILFPTTLSNNCPLNWRDEKQQLRDRHHQRADALWCWEFRSWTEDEESVCVLCPRASPSRGPSRRTRVAWTGRNMHEACETAM